MPSLKLFDGSYPGVKFVPLLFQNDRLQRGIGSLRHDVGKLVLHEKIMKSKYIGIFANKIRRLGFAIVSYIHNPFEKHMRIIISCLLFVSANGWGQTTSSV